MEQRPLEEKLKKLTIVYVEDEESVRERVAATLRRRVGTLYVAANGEEGLALIKTHQPHMVITDLEMPVMTGMEMIRQAKAHLENLCDVPVIVVTAYQDDEHFTELANLYVYKPIHLDELIDSMIKLMIECEI